MKLPSSDLPPTTEVGLCYLTKWRKRRIITFYFETSTVDVGECIQPWQHWSKTAQLGGNSTGKVAFHHSIICQGVSSFISFVNEVTNFQSFSQSTIVDLTFRILTCRFLLAVVSRT